MVECSYEGQVLSKLSINSYPKLVQLKQFYEDDSMAGNTQDNSPSADE